jgi:hypothetical protein
VTRPYAFGEQCGGCHNDKNLPRGRILSVFMEFLSGGEANVKLKEPVGREFSRGSKEDSWFGEYEGEVTEERPLLLELELISRVNRLHARRQNRNGPISCLRGPKELEKITRLKPW